MMTLFEAYNFMNFVLDKDYNGQVLKPGYYNSLLQASNLSYYKLKFGLPEDYLPGQPISRQAVDISRKLTDDLRKFKLSESISIDGQGVGSFPGDYSHMDVIYFTRVVTIDGQQESYTSPVEELTGEEMADRRGNYTKMPTQKDPACVYTAKGLLVYPVTINNVSIVYYKIPTQPVFAYTIVSDEIQYDSGNSTEWEWPEDCHVDIIRVMLSDMGMNLREQLITEFSELKMQKGI